MSFFKKAISTSMVFALASSSSCYVRGYTSAELKDMAARLLCANYSYFYDLNPRSYKWVIRRTEWIISRKNTFKLTIHGSKWFDNKKILYDRTLAALNNLEEKYGYKLTDENFCKWYEELREICCKISDIIYRCKKYAHDIPPHCSLLEYIFNYPSKLDNILSDMSMQKLQANDVKLDLLKNLSSDGVWQDWVNEFDKDFFKAAWEEGAIQEWVWYLCQSESNELFDHIKEMDYDEAREYFNQHYGNVHWLNIAFSAMRILAFQYNNLVKN